ncbi:putative quinol monooxygenase [Haloarchaeobius sp. DFWS5]|uniref:putative quinol monooxygenase n=1 Tax=Haloarchaeobius sp. DFWS5 TaxID=3446114 RepID=UPI003EBC15BD
MFVILTTVPVDPDRRDEFCSLAEALADRSQREAGTIEYRVMADLTDPNTVRFFERYEDQTALEAHTESEEYRAFVEALPALSDGKLHNVQFEVDDAIDEFEFPAEAAVPEE